MGFLGGFILLKIPTKWYKKVSWVLTIIVIASLTLLLFYGKITNHAQSWFYIPVIGFGVQPSEFAKSAALLRATAALLYSADVPSVNVLVVITSFKFV